MSATSAPRYFARVASASDRASDVGWFDSGSPTDADEGTGSPQDGVGTQDGGALEGAPDPKAAPRVAPAGSWWTYGPMGATSSVSAEAQQGDGPAAASASASAVGPSTQTMAVSVVVGPHGAAAAGPFGVVVAGPDGVAAASQVGVAAVGPHGAASASNSANSTSAVVDDDHEQSAPREG